MPPTPPRPLLSRSWAIAQLPGLDPADQAQLARLNIHTTAQLLQQAKTVGERQAIATRLQLHIKHINKWVALANLARIPSVGCQHCGLLLHAGISSPKLLAQMPIAKLHQQILRLHVTNLQRPDLCPGVEDVALWIHQARELG